MNSRKLIIIQCAALLLAAVGAAVVLYVFPPEQSHFYPRCLLYTLTGWQCPGCGGLRAAHHLLHGRLALAFQYNPLLVGLAPLLTALTSLLLISRWRGKPLRHPFTHPAWVWVLVGALLAFGIVRNV
jgi:hypothetical protein